MSHYTHFTTEERELSRVLKAQGLNQTQIAERLGKTSPLYPVNSGETAVRTVHIPQTMPTRCMPNAGKTAGASLFLRTRMRKIM